MTLARRSRLLALVSHAVLRCADLVRDALVLVRDPAEVVEHVERVREARRREQQRERVGLLLPVELVDAIPETAQRDRVLPPQQLQTLGLQPEELVQPAQALAAKLELALERLELDGDVVDPLGERADLGRGGLHLRAEGSLSALGLRHPCSERRDLRVHGLLSLFDRVRTGGRSRDHCQHEDKSRTADHAASFRRSAREPSRGWSESFHRPGRFGPQRSDERTVVLIGHLAGAVVELELLQRVECTIALLHERQPLPPPLVERAEPVVRRSHGGLAEERPRDVDGAGGGEQPAEEERPGGRGHAFTATARS